MLLVVTVIIFAGCGAQQSQGLPTTVPATEATAVSQPTVEPTTIPMPTEVPTAAPTSKEKQKLTILSWQAVTTLNPHLATGVKDFNGATVILEPLARYNENDELVPFLAAEIPTIENGGIAPDGTSITWKIKPGLKWSDGSDFTIDDIIFTWRYCADETTGCTNKTSFDPIANIEQIDETTFKITWKEPNPNPYISFVGSAGMILQQKQFANCIGSVANTDANGSTNCSANI